MSEPSQSSTLTYATGERSQLSTRAWSILFWIAAAHLAVFLGLIALAWLQGGLGHIIDFIRDLPRDQVFPVAFLINLLIGPVVVLANILAVLGYRAGALHRSPRRWFVPYVPLQLSLLALQWGLAIYLVAAGPFVYSSPPPMIAPATAPTSGGVPIVTSATSVLTMEAIGLIFMPLAQALIAFPLLLLLAPRIRRACFAV
jgi:hypothetical protein